MSESRNRELSKELDSLWKFIEHGCDARPEDKHQALQSLDTINALVASETAKQDSDRAAWNVLQNIADAVKPEPLEPIDTAVCRVIRDLRARLEASVPSKDLNLFREVNRDLHTKLKEAEERIEQWEVESHHWQGSDGDPIQDPLKVGALNAEALRLLGEVTRRTGVLYPTLIAEINSFLGVKHD